MSNPPASQRRIPSTISSDVLARRLRELAGEERSVQVDFLLHLAEFDERRAFLEAGYDSLWTYCQRALHLREGPAARRIGAMRMLRRFPALESLLRDGRLCLSTVTLLAPLLTPDNFVELTQRAEYRSKSEVMHLVASLQPRTAPRQGIRRVSQPDAERSSRSDRMGNAVVTNAAGAAAQAGGAARAGGAAGSGDGAGADGAPTARNDAAITPETDAHAKDPLHSDAQASPDDPLFARPRVDESQRAEVRPVSRDEWSLRVTIDAEMKAGLETLASLLSHTAGSNLASVLREAIRCGIEKHGKRKGAVSPTVERARGQSGGAAAESDARFIPASVRREVWRRDQGCCAWTAKDGQRCRSRWKLEIDHVRPVARGGRSTVDNLRILCRAHNILHAQRVFGARHMAKFTGASGSKRTESRTSSVARSAPERAAPARAPENSRSADPLEANASFAAGGLDARAAPRPASAGAARSGPRGNRHRQRSLLIPG